MMLDGRREDVMAVWNALPEGSFLFETEGQKQFRKDEDWGRLVQYLQYVIADED